MRDFGFISLETYSVCSALLNLLCEEKCDVPITLAGYIEHESFELFSSCLVIVKHVITGTGRTE